MQSAQASAAMRGEGFLFETKSKRLESRRIKRNGRLKSIRRSTDADCLEVLLSVPNLPQHFPRRHQLLNSGGWWKAISFKAAIFI